jgi:hypothetical protein
VDGAVLWVGGGAFAPSAATRSAATPLSSAAIPICHHLLPHPSAATPHSAASLDHRRHTYVLSPVLSPCSACSWRQATPPTPCGCTFVGTPVSCTRRCCQAYLCSRWVPPSWPCAPCCHRLIGSDCVALHLLCISIVPVRQIRVGRDDVEDVGELHWAAPRESRGLYGRKEGYGSVSSARFVNPNQPEVYLLLWYARSRAPLEWAAPLTDDLDVVRPPIMLYSDPWDAIGAGRVAFWGSRGRGAGWIRSCGDLGTLATAHGFLLCMYRVCC